MAEQSFFVGLDDTDAPDGMCTTWLGALLAKVLQQAGMKVISARLVRLNPTIPYKTRGNASISLQVMGDPDFAFQLACSLVLKHASFYCPNTHPGVVVATKKPPADFYWKAVCDHCTINEVREFLISQNLIFQGYKLGRGLIGATAAICSELPDFTWELLAYRRPDHFLLPRRIDDRTFLYSELVSCLHTWDTWDYDLQSPVCVPHTPDPVLYGIRGDSPFSISHATSIIDSEPVDMIQIWKTNQGTDAHLVLWEGGILHEGISYLIRGVVRTHPVTGEGGHVSVAIQVQDVILTCMAYEPTKKFRNIIRALRPGDEILIAGSYLKEALNLEKMYLFFANPYPIVRPPVCPSCNKRMTSAGSGKGYKCRRCGQRENNPEIVFEERAIISGWYEVPPGARRHLSRPLARGDVQPDPSYLPIYRCKTHFQ
jgi:tRNA(Ile2)-agmatinylcytidine synthase